METENGARVVSGQIVNCQEEPLEAQQRYRESHKGVLYTCLTCDKQFTRKEALYQHQRCHKQDASTQTVIYESTIRNSE